jgi:hypothetical protein
MATPSEYNTARGIALMVYEQAVRASEPHEAALERCFGVAASAFPDVDSEAFRHDIATSVVINVGPAIEMIGKEDHQPWLRAKKQDLDWVLWNRYRQYLLTVRKLPPPVIERLDEVSDQILGLLEDPSTVGRQFDRRGLVMGQVQSGKTTNYSALVNKALDSGYRLVVVLAGQHNNLRSQTQSRLDEEVLGFDTALAESTAADHGRFGVGLVPGYAAPMVGSLTTSDENGDFNSTRARTRVDAGGKTPFVLVVKKNGSVLKRLVEYLRDHSPYSKHEPASGRTIVPDVPLLVIDDEADQASINTADLPTDEDGNPLDDYDPTKINRLIRELLFCFTQSAYVGYTATPFANIFIHDAAPLPNAGEDLFPRSFIISLRAPENYVGPERLLGIPDGVPMPVFRVIDDADSMIPDRHRKTHVPTALAPSLKEAIHAFLLATAARRVRGQATAHNSMLIHVTRFVAVQLQLRDLVNEYLTQIRRRLQYGEGKAKTTFIEQLEELWRRDFEPTTLELDGEPTDWTAISTDIPRVIDLTTVRAINGSSADLLDYRENAETGINVIAVGGDKLSRGLTLEGLTISYFLRASKMYDTLMQMGRWFGYRDNYADLVRLYTTDQLYSAYRHIAAATEELREEFEYMVSIGATPKDFGLRVRAHPTMMVTSPFKMRQGERLRLSYQGDVSETTLFDRELQVISSNLAATDRFITGLGPVSAVRSDNFLWFGVEAETIINFLDQFRTHRSAPRADSKRLASFVRVQNRQVPPELLEWTVALISKRDGTAHRVFPVEGGRKIFLTLRKRSDDRSAPSRFTIQRLLSPTDELLDLSEEERVRAADLTRTRAIADAREYDPDKPPSGKAIRAVRPPQRGLMLLYPLDPASYDLPEDAVPVGLGISFPESASGATIEYVVNRIWKDDEPDYELL